MYLQVTTITIILLVNCVGALLLAFYLLLQKKVKGSRALGILILSCAYWSFTSAVESTLGTMEARVFWSKISYFGIAMVPPIWFLLSIEFSETKSRFLKIFKYLAFIIPIITIILVLTNDSHRLIWTEITPKYDKVEDGLNYEHGNVFLIYTAYSYILMLAGAFLISKKILSTSIVNKTGSILLLLAMFIPWIVNIYSIFFNPNLSETDITPITLLITSAILSFGILRYRIFSVLNVAKDAVFEQIENVIIVLDKEGYILDYNLFAKKIFNKLPTAYAVGISLIQASLVQNLLLPVS